jgi:hypothetical protein
MFSIRVHLLIPLAMVAFLRSQRLAEVLTFFLELCQLSRSNIFPLHRGAVDLLFLRAFRIGFIIADDCSSSISAITSHPSSANTFRHLSPPE